MAEKDTQGREALEQLLKSLNMDSVIKGSEIAATIPEDKRTFAQREDVAEFMRYKSLSEEQNKLTESTDKMAMGGMMYAKGSLVGNQSELDKNKDGEISAEDFKMLREKKVFGSLAKLGNKAAQSLLKKTPKSKQNENEELKDIINDIETFNFEIDEEVQKLGLSQSSLDKLVKQGEKNEKLLKEKFNYTDDQLNDIAKDSDNVLDYFDDITGRLVIEADKKLKKIDPKDYDSFKFKKLDPDFPPERQPLQEGGSLMVPPEMEGMADDMPVDTYPNIPPEEMAAAQASQLPDAEMEDKYMDFVVNESLDSEEQSYLMNALEADPMLSQIFDKVLMTASEFTGAGEVEGPGTGVSDSIPARLSDGEFVFTKKATDQIGADNLQMMMDDAERAFDGGEMRMPKQEGGMMMYKQKDEDPLAYEKIAQDEIKKNMLRANRAPSLLGVN